MSTTEDTAAPSRWQYADEHTQGVHDNIPISGFVFDEATIQRFQLEAGQYHDRESGIDDAIYALIDWAARVHPTTFVPADEDKVVIADNHDDAHSPRWLAIDRQEVVNLEDLR